MKILLVAGGSPELWPAFLATDYDRFVGIDRGTLYLLENQLIPTFAVGDFDSLSAIEKKAVDEQVTDQLALKPEKDDTDTQLALLETFNRYPEAQVTLIGATGGRLDHLLANLWLGLEPRFFPYLNQLQLKDKQNTFRYLTPGKHVIQKIPGMTYLSYCCLTPVENLTLTESKYTLDHVQVKQATSFVSNEFLAESAVIEFSAGIVAVIQSRD